MLGQQRGSTGEPDPTPPCALMHTSLFVSINIGLRTCQSQAGCQRRAPHARRHRQRPAPAGRPHRGPEHASPVSARVCHTNNISSDWQVPWPQVTVSQAIAPVTRIPRFRTES